MNLNGFGHLGRKVSFRGQKIRLASIDREVDMNRNEEIPWATRLHPLSLRQIIEPPMVHILDQ
jgi:hypothetical protein